MKRETRQRYVGADSADKQAEAILLAQNTKTGNDKGAGNSVENGERLTVPSLATINGSLGSEPWAIGGRSGRYPTIRLTVASRSGIEREVDLSQNKFNKALRLQQFTDGKAHVHPARWSSVLSTWFRCTYDVWCFLAWLSDSYQKNGIEPIFDIIGHTDVCKKYGTIETERVDSWEIKPAWAIDQPTLESALNAFFTQYPACERGESLPWAPVYAPAQPIQQAQAPQTPQTPNFGA